MQEVVEMCNEQAELFDVFGRIASFLGKLLGHKLELSPVRPVIVCLLLEL